MAKYSALILLLLQAVLYAGPVCGAYGTAAESMDCCLRGEPSEGVALLDGDAAACCGNCDSSDSRGMTTSSRVTVPLPTYFAPTLLGNIDLLPTTAAMVQRNIAFQEQWSFQKFKSSDPPKPFLLNESFLI